MSRIEPNPPGVMLYYRWNQALQLLTDAQRGQILSAILTYGTTGTVPDFDEPITAFAWQVIQPQMDADRERYAQIVEKRREAANRRWNPEKPSASPPHAGQASANQSHTSAAPRRTSGLTTEAENTMAAQIERYGRWM